MSKVSGVVEVLSVRLMSSTTAAMFRLLVVKEKARASELAEVANIESKQVYPRLKYWTFRGLVAAEKDPVAHVNIYRLTDKARALVNELKRFAEEVLQSVRGKKSPRKILEEAEKRYRERFGREMSETHRLVLTVFIEHALSKSSPYIAIKPGEETLPQVIKTAILQKLGRDLNTEDIVEALRELEIAKVIYIDRKRFKARLDRSLL